MTEKKQWTFQKKTTQRPHPCCYDSHFFPLDAATLSGLVCMRSINHRAIGTYGRISPLPKCVRIRTQITLNCMRGIAAAHRRRSLQPDTRQKANNWQSAMFVIIVIAPSVRPTSRSRKHTKYTFTFDHIGQYRSIVEIIIYIYTVLCVRARSASIVGRPTCQCDRVPVHESVRVYVPY